MDNKGKVYEKGARKKKRDNRFYDDRREEYEKPGRKRNDRRTEIPEGVQAEGFLFDIPRDLVLWR